MQICWESNPRHSRSELWRHATATLWKWLCKHHNLGHKGQKVSKSNVWSTTGKCKQNHPPCDDVFVCSPHQLALVQNLFQKIVDCGAPVLHLCRQISSAENSVWRYTFHTHIYFKHLKTCNLPPTGQAFIHNSVPFFFSLKE